jgi:membrane fusion protein (multidrug efflux system)
MYRVLRAAFLACAATAPLGALSVGGCAAESHQEEVPRYDAVHPLVRDTDVSREYVAQIRAFQHIEVRALERGYLQDVLVDEGRAVTAGQPLFQIMPTLYEAELQQAEAEAAFARIEFENTQALAARSVVSDSELGLARAKLDQAEAAVVLARTHLALTQIRAPFDGFVGRLEARKGSLLEEGDLLTTLADNRQLWVYFNVSEAEYLAYQRQVEADDAPAVGLRLANGEMFSEVGEITAIEADFNNETGNIAFRATFPNPERLLRHGETGQIVLTRVLPGALLVPQRATFDVLDRKYVYVLDDAGVAHQREIHVGEALHHLFVVEDGLAATDVVLLDGIRKVRDGQVVGVDVLGEDEVYEHLELHAE